MSRWEALVRMEERIWAVAAWIGFLSLGVWGLGFWCFWRLGLGGGFLVARMRMESSLSLEMLRALSRWKDGEVVVARLARRDCMDVVGSRAAKRFSSGEIISSSDVRRWDWSLILRMTQVFIVFVTEILKGKAVVGFLHHADGIYRQRILAQLFLERGNPQGHESGRWKSSPAEHLTSSNLPDLLTPAATEHPSWATGWPGGNGSLATPYQAFITAYRPSGSGIPLVAGYGTPNGGYGVGSQAVYSDLDQIIGAVDRFGYFSSD